MAVDADTGVGIGFSSIAGSGTAITGFYTPPVRTALSLGEYAELLGINPIQFMSGNASSYFPSTGCTDRWRQYAWQDEDRTSRDELAREILQAELDIAAQLGYYPGEMWVEDERISYPRFYRRAWTTVTGRNVAGYYKSVKLKYGKFRDSGARTATYVGTADFTSASLALADDDGDGFNEVVVLTIPTTGTNPYEHKVFFTGKSGDMLWEIRPVFSKAISGGVLTARIPVWLMFNPELLAAFPGPNGMTDIDPAVQANLVQDVEVYRITANATQVNQFYWLETGTLNDDIGPTTQVFAAEEKIGKQGFVTVTPATWDAATSKWTVVAFDVAREPDYLKISYRSGAYISHVQSGEYRVPPDLAQAISMMATARLARPLCTQCQNVKDKEMRLRTDMAFSATGATGDVRFVTPDVLTNPFGTKLGEVEAWRIIRSRIEEGEINARVAVF